MQLAEIIWFGGTVRETGRKLKYGFLRPFGEKSDRKDIFVHVSGVRKDSAFLENHEEGTWVVYEPVFSSERQKWNATDVRLLDELSPEENHLLYQNITEESEELAGKLRWEFPELLKQEPPEFFIPYLDEPDMRAYFVKQCRELSQENILTLHNQMLAENHVQAAQLLRRECADVFAGAELRFFVPWLDEPDMRTCFLQKCQAMKLMEVKEALEDCWQSDKNVMKLLLLQFPGLYLSHLSRLFNPSSLLFYNVSLSKELDIKDELKEELVRLKDDRSFMTKVLSTLFRGGWNALCRSERDYFWNYIEYRELLSKLEADEWPEIAVIFAESLRREKTIFNNYVWNDLPDSIKIRIIIYLSNFAFTQERERCHEFLTDALYCTIEKADGEVVDTNSLLVDAVLHFALIPYCSSNEKRQQRFMEAHEGLMRYIANSFSEGTDITHGLNILLDRCRDSSYRDITYFCDARPPKKPEKPGDSVGNVFCPRGKGRPDGGWHKCDFFQNGDLRHPVRKRDFQEQSLSDLLQNIRFIPDLREISIYTPEEYPYRIASYVDRLLDIRPHLRCQKCGALFRPKFQYSRRLEATLSMNTFTCPNANIPGETGHDRGIYINYCCSCHQVIDQRECLRQDGIYLGHRSEYLCMYCGATEHVESGTCCPVCGLTAPRFLESKGRYHIKSGVNMGRWKGGRIICKNPYGHWQWRHQICGGIMPDGSYNGIYFQSRFERNGGTLYYFGKEIPTDTTMQIPPPIPAGIIPTQTPTVPPTYAPYAQPPMQTPLYHQTPTQILPAESNFIWNDMDNLDIPF